MTDKNIKPCPFCGHKDVKTIVRNMPDDSLIRFFYCENMPECGLVASFRTNAPARTEINWEKRQNG